MFQINEQKEVLKLYKCICEHKREFYGYETGSSLIIALGWGVLVTIIYIVSIKININGLIALVLLLFGIICLPIILGYLVTEMYKMKRDFYTDKIEEINNALEVLEAV